MYRWQQVKKMRADGFSIKKIARVLKISKNTVRKYLRDPDPPQFNPRDYPKELDKHRQEIDEMLAKKYIGTRVYAELTRRGYRTASSRRPAKITGRGPRVRRSVPSTTSRSSSYGAWRWTASRSSG